jgi:glycosyltransferase involved in cell wall biosynthesis
MRALALTETPDHVCGRYRIRAFAPALEAAGCSLVVQGISRAIVGRFRQIERASEFDTVVLQRKLLPGWQLDHLRRRARHLVFDFDDAVLYRDSYDRRGPHCERRERRFRRTVQLVDVVIAGNDFLADCALRSGAHPERVRVIPTCIPTERYPVSDHPRRRAGIDLTWIGSSSTLVGLETQRALWERIGRDVEGSRLRLICDRFPEFGSLPVIPVSWSEATEASELAVADVGVSWIPNDLWSRGKCGLKLLQYQAAGLPAVANPVGVHPEMIRPGITGFLPNTSDEWIDAIRTLRNDPQSAATMGAAARKSVDQGYSVTAWAPTFVGTIAGNSTPPPPKSRVFTPPTKPTRRPVILEQNAPRSER